MSKKRKTRKQKESAEKRHFHPSHIHELQTPMYSVSVMDKPSKDLDNKKLNPITIERNTFLKKDINAIAAASGIVLAFDILLYVLLSTGTLKLGFLGY